MTEELAIREDDDGVPELTEEQRARFLEIVESDKTIGTRQALALAGVTRTVTWNGSWAGEIRPMSAEKPLTGEQVKKLLDADPELNDAYLAARGRHPEQIRASIADRAINGWEKPVYQGGVKVGTVWEFSPTLLLAMAKANLPEYRDAGRLEVTGDGGGPVVVQQGVSLDQVAAVLLAARALRPSEGGDVFEHDGEPGELGELEA